MAIRQRGRLKLLTVEELREKARGIRDHLEPDIARNGAHNLSPDTVLELASFLARLQAQTTSTGAPILPQSPNSAGPATPTPAITLTEIQQSRIHRALLLISGRGTRWPKRLVEISDEVIKSWTDQFGPLANIPHPLYEKGGTLADMHEERDLGRHALMLKWLSDTSTLVSPLQAMEPGHLDVRPGRWYIHSIFAFREGLIDSPDAHGGITADSDGIYAIMLTGYDEIIDCDGAETFTYLLREGEVHRSRLLEAMLHPKPPIRVLRSHTLRSVFSPVAGLRYDGLYKIISYKVGSDPSNRSRLRWSVTFKREPADQYQSPMREVRKYPKAEDVDDYIEYKRLRGMRQKRLHDAPKKGPKHDKLLGIIHSLHDNSVDNTPDDDDISITGGARRSVEFGASGLYTPGPSTFVEFGTSSPYTPGSPTFTGGQASQSRTDYFSARPEAYYDGTSASSVDAEEQSNDFHVSVPSPGLPSPDAYSPLSEEEPFIISEWPAPLLPHADCSMPQAHFFSMQRDRRNRADSADISPKTSEAHHVDYGTEPVPAKNGLSPMDDTIERPLSYPIRPCTHVLASKADWRQAKEHAARGRHVRDKQQASAQSGYTGSRLSHSLQCPSKLFMDHEGVHELHAQMTMIAEVTNARGMSKRFYEELGAILSIVERWQKEAFDRDGAVWSCYAELQGKIRDMRRPGRVDWLANVRDAGLGCVEKLQKRYMVRRSTFTVSKEIVNGSKPSWNCFLDPAMRMDEKCLGLEQEYLNRLGHEIVRH